MRFSKGNLVEKMRVVADNQIKHHKLDCRTGYAQLIAGADVNSMEWWDKVHAYFRANELLELAQDIEDGSFL